MVGTITSELVAFVVFFLYASFFEWSFHKYLFHSGKFIKATFRAHTLVHHQRFKYDPRSYHWQEGQDKEHIAMDWFALPMFIGVHLPFFWAIEHFTHWQCLWGGVAAVTAYYAVYEYFHYCMHVPGGRRFERLRIFTFVKEHHRIHHRYMQQNLNVFFPLADLCLGTFRSRSSVPQQAVTAAPAPAAPVQEEPLTEEMAGGWKDRSVNEMPPLPEAVRLLRRQTADAKK